MKKRVASSALLAACLALLCACAFAPGDTSGNKSGDNPDQYQIAFTVDDGSSSTAYTWAAEYQNVGFYDSYSGYYSNIFCAADGSAGEIYTTKHVYVHLPNSGAGAHSSDDGVTALVYYDRLGNRYGVDADYPTTYLDVDVSVDGLGFLRGSFTGRLVSPNAYLASAYVNVSGTIFSYFE